MARNRTLYQSEGIFASQNLAATGSGNHAQIRRVQSANYGYEIARTDVLQYGNLARIDSIITSSPTVNLDFSYLLGDGYNERVLGFHVANSGGLAEGNFASGAVTDVSGRNFYIVTASEGTDLNSETGPAALSGKGVIGISNAYISNYSVSAAVGDLPTVSVTVEGLNNSSQTYICNGATTGIVSPAIAPESGTPLSLTTGTRLPIPTPATGDGIPTCLRPGDISISFGALTGLAVTKTGPMANVDMGSTNSINIQSFELSLPLSLSPIERLGSKFAFARVVDFPVTVTLSVDAIVNETTARNLAQMVEDTTDNDITITIRKPGSSEVAIQYTLKGAKLDSESFSSDIGSNKSVSMQYSAQLAGPNSLDKGVFCSGSFVGNVYA